MFPIRIFRPTKNGQRILWSFLSKFLGIKLDQRWLTLFCSFLRKCLIADFLPTMFNQSISIIWKLWYCKSQFIAICMCMYLFHRQTYRMVVAHAACTSGMHMARIACNDTKFPHFLKQNIPHFRFANLSFFFSYQIFSALLWTLITSQIRDLSFVSNCFIVHVRVYAWTHIYLYASFTYMCTSLTTSTKHQWQT